ncbi:MAG: M20/M25/M40 family metallo-hydrolase [Caldilineaceae bacterium]
MNHQSHPAVTLLSELLAVASPSGYEGRLAEIVRTKLSGFGYQPETDGAGNVFVRFPGQNPQAPLVCLAAHMDEIGFVVTRIEADGSLRLQRNGGLYPWKQGEGPVEIVGDQGSITAVLSMGSTHAAVADRAVQWEDVRVITGLTPEQLRAVGVRPGSPGVPIQAVRGPVIFGDLADPLLGAWTFDDRMGVVALLRLLETIQKEGLQPQQPTIIAFVTCEEVGGFGAKALAQRERPHTFIAIDGCPIPPGTPLQIDGRPGIWTYDRHGPYNPKLVAELSQLAQTVGTELQPAAYNSTASDASMVYEVGGAERVACFGHVRENSHGYEVARLSVFDNLLKVLVAFIKQWKV